MAIGTLRVGRAGGGNQLTHAHARMEMRRAHCIHSVGYTRLRALSA